MACNDPFAAWRAEMENAPEFWCVRNLSTATLYRNRKWREALGVTSETMCWADALKAVRSDQARLVEDAHLRAMQTGATQRFVTVSKIAPHKYTLIESIATHRRCSGCRTRCGFIAILSDYLADADDADDAFLSEDHA